MAHPILGTPGVEVKTRVFPADTYTSIAEFVSAEDLQALLSPPPPHARRRGPFPPPALRNDEPLARPSSRQPLCGWGAQPNRALGLLPFSPLPRSHSWI